MRRKSQDLLAAEIERDFWKMLYHASRMEWKKWFLSSASKDQIIELLAEEVSKGDARIKALLAEVAVLSRQKIAA